MQNVSYQEGGGVTRKPKLLFLQFLRLSLLSSSESSDGQHNDISNISYSDAHYDDN